MKKSNSNNTYNRRVAKVFEPQGKSNCLHTRLEYEGDVGYDLAARELFIVPADGGWYGVPTGVRVAPPPGFWFELCGRSSNLSQGIMVNRGIIDSGYRGPLLIMVRNMTNRVVHLMAGERIAQLIAHPVIHMDWERVTTVENLGQTDRGDNGFGSTGR